MWPWNGRHVRAWGFTLFGVAVALFVLGLVPGTVPTEIALTATMVICFVILCGVVWGIATGRVGLRRWEPTPRRQRRLERRAVARAQAEALVQQQRLDAALSHGRYRPEPPPPVLDERAAARQELLDAAERYGSLSPQARAAAEKAKRARG
jgi:hypothetical protein